MRGPHVRRASLVLLCDHLSDGCRACCGVRILDPHLCVLVPAIVCHANHQIVACLQGLPQIHCLGICRVNSILVEVPTLLDDRSLDGFLVARQQRPASAPSRGPLYDSGAVSVAPLSYVGPGRQAHSCDRLLFERPDTNPNQRLSSAATIVTAVAGVTECHLPRTQCRRHEAEPWQRRDIRIITGRNGTTR